jgi:hypothetical protein
MTAFFLMVLFAGWGAGAACLRYLWRRSRQTRTRTAGLVMLSLSLFTLPLCAVGAFYWWWRLGMLWTPDELPGIQFQFRLWTALLVFIAVLAVSTIALLFRRSHENAD